MKELNDIEVTCVSGGTLSGMIVGAVDGAATGMAIGGKWGGAGGFGFGALSQLVGLVVPTAMGALAGGTVGLFTNAETAVGYLGQYRENFGPGDVGRTTI
ncbi:hypothetical protein VVD44_00015 [Pseudomonas aeruginosa]|uniref:DUF5862 family protein n=1 Tax=Pseudomonas aeruginosa TaxID=287 RepID=UPI003008E575